MRRTLSWLTPPFERRLSPRKVKQEMNYCASKRALNSGNGDIHSSSSSSLERERQENCCGAL
jgi:hypothetical protein